MGTIYKIAETGAESARGGLVATEVEQRYDIVADGGPGTFLEADFFFRDWIKKNAPIRYRNLLDLENGIEVEEDEDSNGQVWRATVRYKARTIQNDADDASSVEYGAYVSGFSTAGGTAHITRSFATARYAIGGPAPDMLGQIGWNGEDFDGCDIIVPNFAFEITSRTPPGTVEDFGDLADLLASFIGKTNERRFLGFNPGVVLYTGISSGSLQTAPATETTDEYYYWQVTHTFQASPNATLNVGGVPVPKPGWAYFWTLTEKSWDPTTNRITPKIVAAYVETVYGSADFARLGIGYNI